MDLLVGLELGEKGVEGAEVVEGRGRVWVEDGGQGEAKEEEVCGAPGEAGGGEGGEFEDVGAREEEGVVPVDAAFVTFVGVSR